MKSHFLQLLCMLLRINQHKTYSHQKKQLHHVSQLIALQFRSFKEQHFWRKVIWNWRYFDQSTTRNAIHNRQGGPEWQPQQQPASWFPTWSDGNPWRQAVYLHSLYLGGTLKKNTKGDIHFANLSPSSLDVWQKSPPDPWIFKNGGPQGSAGTGVVCPMLHHFTGDLGGPTSVFHKLLIFCPFWFL